jgi:hypothetical protein
MVAGCRHFLQVVSGTEDIAGGSQHDHPRVFVIARCVERGLKGGHHLFRQRILALRPIHGERENAPFAGFYERRLCGAVHDGSPLEANSPPLYRQAAPSESAKHNILMLVASLPFR